MVAWLNTVLCGLGPKPREKPAPAVVEREGAPSPEPRAASPSVQEDGQEEGERNHSRQLPPISTEPLTVSPTSSLSSHATSPVVVASPEALSNPPSSSSSKQLPTSPPSTVAPRLPQLQRLHNDLAGHQFSLVPPTPVEAPPNPSPFTRPTPRATPPPLAESPVSSFFVPTTPPSAALSPPSFPGTLSPTLDVPDSPTPSGSPAPSVHSTHSVRGDLSPSSPSGFRHKRTGSADSRKFKETLNAFTAEAEDGSGGRRVNQYLLEKGMLGKGSYANVLKCRDTSIDPPFEYAAKSFSKSRIRSRLKTSEMRGPAGRGRGRARRNPMPRQEPTPTDLDQQGPINLALVQSEVAIMKKLNHPNVAQIHEVIDVTDDDELLIIMELCAGGPISKVTMETKGDVMNEEKARDVFRQLILGVAYLHHNDIIHRDIKPDNCLFMEDLITVKLVDFGVSEMFIKKHDDKVRKSAGSPAYMAPELIDLDPTKLQEGIHGQATDIWSLGVTLYILVTGELPFVVESIADLYDAIVKNDVVIPTSLSPTLQKLLSRILDKNPETRITTEQLWEDAWVTAESTDPLPTYEENCATPIAAPTRDELESALMGFRTKAQVARAANKFRTLGRRSVSEGSSTDNLRRTSTGEKEGSEEGKSLLMPERKDTGSSFATVETNATSLPSGNNSANGHSKE